MTKVQPCNGNEAKSYIFAMDILKSDATSFFTKKY